VSSDTWWNRTLVYLGLKEEPEDVYDEVVGSANGAEERASVGACRGAQPR
jgi:hypothetical protein